MSKLVHFPCRSKPQVRLMCFPHAGAGASIFREWADNLDEIEVCAVQLPGRENRLREAALCDLTDAVEQTAPLVAALEDLPVVLFGHSLGAFLAFETARWLRNNTMSGPLALIVAGQRAPHMPDPQSPLYESSDDILLESISERYGGIADIVRQHPELRQIALVSLRGDMTMHDTYRFASEASLECPLLSLGGEEDIISRDESQAWQEHTTGPFEYRMFPGGHFFIQSQQRDVLNAIRMELDAALSTTNALESPIART